MKTRALLTAALAFGVFGAANCRSDPHQLFIAPANSAGGAPGTDPGPPPDQSGNAGFMETCPTSKATQVLGLIGPDVNTHVLCGPGVVTTIPLASVDVTGDGSTTWSIDVTGDPAFILTFKNILTCQASSPAIATVDLKTPDTAVPGTTFDAVATVTSDDDSFPSGQVNLHAEAIAPPFTLDRTTVDFGDVPPDHVVTAPVTAVSEFLQAVGKPSELKADGFYFEPGTDQTVSFNARTTAQVSFSAHDPGDHTATWSWTAGVNSMPACMTTKTVELHARVIGGDGDAGHGADAGAEEDAASADTQPAAD